MKKTYLMPEAEILPMVMEAIVCTSGNGGNLTHERPFSELDEDDFWD